MKILLGLKKRYKGNPELYDNEDYHKNIDKNIFDPAIFSTFILCRAEVSF
jgi:hypothetical protein